MAVNLLEFEPKLLWKYFDELRQIPRESKNEKTAGEYIVATAKKFNLEYDQDEIGNIVVRVPASPGHENAPTVVLQGHLDMVCEKNSDVDFDFAKDAIQVRKEGDWLYAQGTTLGADNGIGVAASLAFIEDKSAVHGPLELLLTVDEETGLTGAGYLKPGFIKGKKFLNLDSEEEGIFTIGCAGGADTIFYLDTQLETEFVGKYIKVAVTGLKGGHSGLDINKNRGNAIKYLVRILWPALETFSFRLVNVNGGSKRNAIAREAYAELVVKDNDITDFKKSIENSFENLENEFHSVEPDMKLEIFKLDGKSNKIFNQTTQKNLFNFLFALPHGVLKMSADIPDLIETSVNLATAQVSDEKIIVGTSSRSSVNSALEATRQKLRALGNLVNAKVEQPLGYPGWKPNLESELLATIRTTYKKVSGKEAEVQAIHAGLECGIIGEKYQGMDMVSVGPQIENPHSPDERVHIPSVANFYNFLKATLEKLA